MLNKELMYKSTNEAKENTNVWFKTKNKYFIKTSCAGKEQALNYDYAR